MESRHYGASELSNINEETMACPVSNSCLGMCEWTSCPGATAVESIDSCATETSTASNHMTEQAHPTIVSHIPVSAAESASSTRFATFVSDEQLAAMSKGVTPAKSTRWALSNFESWKQARNEKHPGDLIPEHLLTSTTQLFLTSTFLGLYWKQGSPVANTYPPKTLHQLLCGILRHMRSINPRCPNFLEKKDSRFKMLHGVMDSHFTNFTPLGLDKMYMQGSLHRMRRRSCGKVV